MYLSILTCIYLANWILCSWDWMGLYLWEKIVSLQDKLCTFAPWCVIEQHLCNLFMQATKVNY